MQDSGTDSFYITFYRMPTEECFCMNIKIIRIRQYSK